MAATFLSTANTFLSTTTSSSSLKTALLCCPQRRHNVGCTRGQVVTLCSESSPSILTKRSFSICFITATTFVFSLGSSGGSSTFANAAILEAEDDEELLEKVKKDRKKRLERQGVINSSKKETGYLQDVVYKLSKVGQAIENNDLSTASSVLGKNTDSEWLQNANAAFTKLSSSPEEKTQVDTFNSSLATLISSVIRNDIESSKNAFVTSAAAFEKWTSLTGLVEQLKGL